MSLEVKHFPQDYRTVYNPVEVVAFETSSTVRGYVGFAYLLDVKDGSTLVGRLRVPPTTDGYGRFDMSGIMESYLSSDVGTLNTSNIEGITANANSWKQFRIELGWEHYNGGTYFISMPKNFTLPGDEEPVANVDLVVFNGSLPKYRRDVENFYDWQATDYYKLYTDGTSAGVYDRSWLTHQPNHSANNKLNLKTELTDEGYMYFLYDHTNYPIDRYRIDEYDASGSILSSAEVRKPTALTDRHCKVAGYPSTINDIAAAELLSGSQPIISTSATSYSLILMNGAINQSERIYFNIESGCRYEKRRIEFLNSLGGFDYFNFTQVSRHSEEIERKFFKQNANDLNTDGTISYSISNKEKVQYYTRSMPSIKLVSNWVSYETFNWLLEMIESPEIYLIDSFTNDKTGAVSNRRVPIKNIKENWEEKREDTDQLFNLEINLEFSMDNYRQRF